MIDFWWVAVLKLPVNFLGMRSGHPSVCTFERFLGCSLGFQKSKKLGGDKQCKLSGNVKEMCRLRKTNPKGSLVPPEKG